MARVLLSETAPGVDNATGGLYLLPSSVEVQESIRRWWSLIHPSDRAVAQKYLLMVLEKSNSTLGAIMLGLPEPKEVKLVRDLDPERMHTRTDRTAISSPA